MENAEKIFELAVKEYHRRLEEIARRNVDKHLGDVCEGADDPETIYEEAYVLALDALHDDGFSDETAREVADKVACSYSGIVNESNGETDPDWDAIGRMMGRNE